MSFFGRIGKWFKRNVIEDFVTPLFRKGIGDALTWALPRALSLVAQVAADPKLLTNDAKRAAVFRGLEGEAKATGIAIGASLINTAIELAVQKLKAGT